MIRLRKAFLRYRQWRYAIQLAGAKAKLWPMLRAIKSGAVDARTYRQRLRICAACPIYDAEFKLCRKVIPQGSLGCSCYVPYLAKTRVPYQREFDVNAIEAGMGLRSTVRGCWGRVHIGRTFGWGEPHQ